MRSPQPCVDSVGCERDDVTTWPEPRRASGESAWLAATKRALDRPLTSYHLVLGASGLLLALGLVMVLSASSVTSELQDGSPYYIFTRQAIWVAVGIPLAWVASTMQVTWIRRMSYPALLVSIVLICLTYVPGFGVEVNGNRNWISFGGPLTLQPSEVAKLAIVLWAADLYARKHKLLTEWKHLLIPMVPVTGLIAALVVGQGDLGTALVLFAVILGMLWVVGAPARLFIGAALAVAGLAMFLATTASYRMNRLLTFTDPLSDYHHTGWQPAHGFFALAQGGWWGVGIGASTEKWSGLPAAHTDFIFAVIGEELGLFGTLVVLGLFVTLAYSGIRIALRTKDRFVRYAAAGITIWLLGQAMVNIGMVLGLLPVIGIPLPLVSYGGSALLPTLISLGLLLAFAKTEPGARTALRAKRRQSWRARIFAAGTARARVPASSGSKRG
jgi:cell division protein FtsW